MSFSRHLIGSLAAAAILAPSLASADAPAAKWYDKVSLTGNVDTYYMVSLNQAGANDWFNGNTNTQSGNAGTVGEVQGRAFDTRANSFQYNADLNLAYSDDASKSSAVVEFIYGPKANAINAANDTFEYEWNTDYSTVAGYVVAQAYVKQGLGPVALTLGKFATPIGYETWNSTANANYSRSLLYTQEPLYSLGAKLDYAAPAGITASLWADNGNSIDYTTSDAKNWGAALSYAGVKNLTLNLQWYEDQTSFSTNNYTTWGYIGTHSQNHGFYDTMHFIDFNFAYQAMASLNIAGEYLYKTAIDGSSQADRDWWFGGTGVQAFSPKAQGYALYATYNTPVENLSAAFRFEQWFSPDGAGSTDIGGITPGMSAYQNGHNSLAEVSSYTLTIKYLMGSLTHILEYRADAANGYIFATNGNNNGIDMSQLQQTVTYAGVYNF